MMKHLAKIRRSRNTGYRQRAPRGLTLIEVIVATAILASAMMCVFAIYSQATVEIRRAKQRTQAANNAQMMMERLIAAPRQLDEYDQCSTSAELATDHPARPDIIAWKRRLQTLTPDAVGTITVTDAAVYRQVAVRISYTSYGRPARSEAVMLMPPADE